MDDKATCPDCGAEFDPTRPIMIQGNAKMGFKVFKCPKCGHFIYLLVQAEEGDEPDEKRESAGG